MIFVLPKFYFNTFTWVRPTGGSLSNS